MVAKDHKQRIDGLEKEDGRLPGGHVQELMSGWSWNASVEEKLSKQKTVCWGHKRSSSLHHYKLDIPLSQEQTLYEVFSLPI